MNDFINSEEARALLGCTRRTLARLTAAGKLPIYRREGDAWNYHRRADVVALAAPKLVEQ